MSVMLAMQTLAGRVALRPFNDTIGKRHDHTDSAEASHDHMTGGVVYTVGSWRLGDDGAIHRRGRLKSPNGDVYDGEWVNGLRHGRGVLTFGASSTSALPSSTASGTYVGEFAEGFYQGFGVLTRNKRQHALTRQWIPGCVYEGDFRRGKMHGRGAEKFTTGERYNGEFVDGYREGKGVCVYANGDVYEGDWVHGQWHGQQGELRRRSGDVGGSPSGAVTYVGEFAHGLFHGFGKCVLAKKGTVDGGSYTGDYVRGLRHGRGRREYADGKTYDGEWDDDEIHGVGVMEVPGETGFKYVGQFVRGLFHGHGVVSYTGTGDSYEGAFKRGLFHGHGSLVYGHGGRYDGSFCDGKRHGHGKRVYQAGDDHWLDAEWVQDAAHGYGVLVKRAVNFKAKSVSQYRYEGGYQHGAQTAQEVHISYRVTPLGFDEDQLGVENNNIAHASDDSWFEWKREYEFPAGSRLWHSGRGASTYVGGILRGEFHGIGKLTSPDGKSWSGTWRYGRLHGDDAVIVYLPLVLRQLQLLMEKKSALKNAQTDLPYEKDKSSSMTARPLGLYRIVQYEGACEEGVRHGCGRVRIENGDTIQGRFERGHAEGVVLYEFFGSGGTRYAVHARGKRLRWLNDEEDAQQGQQELDIQQEMRHEDNQLQSVMQALVI